MFRFSFNEDAPFAASGHQLAAHAVAEDEDFAQRLQDDAADAYREDERYYRAENATPETLEEAVEYVRGIFQRAPDRVWLGGEVYEVEPPDVQDTEAPGA